MTQSVVLDEKTRVILKNLTDTFRDYALAHATLANELKRMNDLKARELYHIIKENS